MIKDKVKSIIEMLILSTKSRNLEWVDNSKPNKRSYHREFEAIGEDGTKYEAEVKYIMNGGNWQLESSPSLWIKSDKLPNGMFYAYGLEYNDIKELRQVLMDEYCKDMSPSDKIVEDALDSISKGISISEYRDSKLNKLLNVFRLSGKK